MVIFLLLIVCGSAAENTVVTEGEEWRISLDFLSPGVNHTLEADIPGVETWVDDPFRLSLQQAYSMSAETVSLPPVHVYLFPGLDMWVVCRYSSVQVFQYDWPNNELTSLWTLPLGDVRILNITLCTTSTSTMVFLLIDTSSGLQVTTFNLTTVFPDSPSYLNFPELAVSDSATILTTQQTNGDCVLLLTCSTGNSSTLHIYELVHFSDAKLRQSYSVLPQQTDEFLAKGIYLQYDLVYIIDQKSEILMYRIFNFALIALEKPDVLSDLGAVNWVSFQEREPQVLLLQTSTALILSTSTHTTSFPGSSLYATVINQWLVSLWQSETGETALEVYNLHWNRTEVRWPVSSAKPFTLTYSFLMNDYMLFWNDDDGFSILNLHLGSRYLEGKATSPGVFSGWIHGKEHTQWQVEVLSRYNSTVLCGYAYNLTSSSTLHLPAERHVGQIGVTLRLERLFSGPDMEFHVQYGDKSIHLPKIYTEFSQLFPDFPANTYFEVAQNDYLIFRSDSQVSLFHSYHNRLNFKLNLTLPSSPLLLSDTSLFTSTPHSLREYSLDLGRLLLEVEVGTTCNRLVYSMWWIVCLGEKELHVYTTKLNHLVGITAELIGKNNTSFKDVSVVADEKSRLIVVIACGVKELVEVELRDFQVKSTREIDTDLEEIVGIAYAQSLLAAIDRKGNIHVFELKNSHFRLVRKIPTWENSPVKEILVGENYIGLLQSTHLRLYNIADTVHNSLYAVYPTQSDCAYRLDRTNLYEYCGSSAKLTNLALSNVYVPGKHSQGLWIPVPLNLGCTSRPTTQSVPPSFKSS